MIEKDSIVSLIWELRKNAFHEKFMWQQSVWRFLYAGDVQEQVNVSTSEYKNSSIYTWNTTVETSDQYDLKKILPGRAQIVLFQIPVSRNKTRFWTPSPEYYWNGFDKYKIIVDAGVIFRQHFQ